MFSDIDIRRFSKSTDVLKSKIYTIIFTYFLFDTFSDFSSFFNLSLSTQLSTKL